MNAGRNPLIRIPYRGFTIGSAVPLTPEKMDRIIGLLPAGRAGGWPVTRQNAAPLGGRASITPFFLEEFGDLVLKPYIRGGLMEPVFRDRFLNTGSCRAENEFSMLITAARCGIPVPEPICFVRKGGLLYRCWLATRKIPSQGNLADLGRTAPQAAARTMDAVTHQIRQLIRHRILHVDLHPGNVLLGTDGRIYLLDFDKACRTRLPAALLAGKYLRRWNRAVTKHRLPDRSLKLSSV